MTPKSSDYGRVFFQAEVFRAGRLTERRPRPSDTIIERARRVPVFRDCDVLVAGGGPAGAAAAIAAARAGADTVLVERHNHLGGLSTGGLVIWIDRMTDWSGQRVIEGIAAELIDRLPRGRWPARRAPIGAAPTRRPPRTGRNEPRPFTASSPGRQRSIRRT